MRRSIYYSHNTEARRTVSEYHKQVDMLAVLTGRPSNAPPVTPGRVVCNEKTAVNLLRALV